MFDFSAVQSVRGRQFYCRASKLLYILVMLASSFYTCYAETNAQQLLMDSGTASFYLKDKLYIELKSSTPLNKDVYRDIL